MNELNYKEGKELRDNKYPQGGKGFGLFPDDLTEFPYRGDEPNVHKDVVYIPTLSELIEAVGEEFNRLERDVDSDTSVVYFVAYAHELLRGSVGKTPSQAVKNLWISLNKK